MKENSGIRYKRFTDAEAKMKYWIDALDEQYKYFYPTRDSFYKTERGHRVTNDLYDSTSLVAASDFANFIQNTLVPQSQDWASLGICESFAKDNNISQSSVDVVIEKLQSDTDTLFSFIHKSNFDQAISESAKDIVVGTGALIIQKGTIDSPLKITSIPISRLVIDGSEDDSIIDSFWRRWHLKPSEIMKKWPNAVIPTELMAEDVTQESYVSLIEGCVYYKKDSDDPEVKEYYYYIQLEDGQNEIYSTWMGYCPFLVFRFDKFPGELMGRGLSEIALPFVKVLNEAEKLGLQAFKFAVSPAYIDMSGRSLNPNNTKIRPGSVTPIRWDGTGVPIQPIQMGGNPRIVEFDILQLRSAIHEILYSDPLGNVVDVKNRTATEIDIRQQNFIKRSGSAAARLAKEMIEPILEKCIYILRSFGILKDINVDGTVYKFESKNGLLEINYNSPILAEQDKRDVKNLTEWVQVVMQITQVPQVGTMLETLQIPMWVAKKLGVDLSLVKGGDDVKQSVQTVTQKSIEAHQANAKQAPENQVDMSKALQAIG